MNDRRSLHTTEPLDLVPVYPGQLSCFAEAWHWTPFSAAGGHY